MATVTADSTRINDSDTNTGWGNYNVGGGAPASEPQRRYQGTCVVGRKATSSTTRTGVTYEHGTTTDCTAAANRLVLLKGTVDDNGDLNATFGLEFAIGSAEGAHAEYNVAGSGSTNDAHTAYNAVGGEAGAYIFAAIDPTITQWRDSTVGSPAMSAVDFFAAGAQFINGAAKSENMGLDAIDIGTGLTYTGTAFSFQDGVDTDQGVANNRWGWSAAVGAAIFLRGLHTVNATGTDTSIVFFPDGMHSTGLAGIAAQTATEFAGSYTGLGRDYTFTDTRPDFTATGSPTLSGQFGNWRLIALNATSTVTGIVEAKTITQGGATFDGATVRTKAAAGVATIVSPTLGDFTATTFQQTGAGHAIEITVAGSYNIDEFRFSGYGPDAATDAAILNSSGGAVTLTRTDGATPVPTVRNINGSTTSIPAIQVQLTFTDLPVGAEFRIYDDDGDGIAQTIGTNREGVETLAATTYTMTYDSSEAGNVIYVQVINPGVHEEAVEDVTLTATNQSRTIRLTPEEHF